MSSSFATLLRTHRRARGLTQRQLAARAALAHVEVCHLEQARIRDPHLSTVAALARALDIDAGALLTPFQDTAVTV
jgi:transcriptional regulator with XRE-family HTH domain